MYTKLSKLQAFTFLFLGIGLMLVIGCNQQGRGFALPEGNVEEGKAAFVRFDCNECHSVGDIEWAGQEGGIHVELGGEVSNLKTYGELVTSIINPSHKISERFVAENAEVSPMTKYNEVMFVNELVNLVTFLQKEYEVDTPPGYYAPYPH